MAFSTSTERLIAKIMNKPIQEGIDYLKKDKGEFEAILSKRIEIGQKLCDETINKPRDLHELSKKFDQWHDYNRELIKRSFNNPNSHYFRDYVYERTKTRAEELKEQLSGSHRLTEQEIWDIFSAEIKNRIQRLEKLKVKLELIEVLPDMKEEQDKQTKALEYLELIFSNFHRVAQSIRKRRKDKGTERPTLIINDEYDVQDLLKGLLKIFFRDIREEDAAPSLAGANSRIDFVLNDEKIVIETKMTSEKLRDKEAGDQLLIDIGRYESHSNCEILVIFVYDRGDHIENKSGIIYDLENKSKPGFKVKVYINPM